MNQKYKYDEGFFKKPTIDNMYWAGFIAADGSIGSKGDFSISLKKSDKEHLIKFKQHTQSQAPIKIYDPRRKNISGINTITSGTVEIRFRAKYWIDDLKNYNIIPNKTSSYDIPDWVISHELFKHFIRGYFDGDGWFSIKKQKRICWGVCGNFSVIEKIQKYLIANCALDNAPSILRQKNIFRFEFQKQHDVVKVCNYLYNGDPVSLDRKYELSKLATIFDNNTTILNIDEETIKEAYSRLKSYKLVANELKCSKSSVFNYIKKYSI